MSQNPKPKLPARCCDIITTLELEVEEEKDKMDQLFELQRTQNAKNAGE